MILTTRRLILRPIRLGEAPLYYEDARLPEVNVAAGMPAPKSFAETRARVRKAAAAWKGRGPRRMAFSIYLKKERAWIGGINIRWPHNGVGELGYALRPAFWGKGYATEAVRAVTALGFRKFAAHRVQATCWVRNTGSGRVLEKAGFRREGRLRGFMRVGDRVRDEFGYGITRADFLRR